MTWAGVIFSLSRRRMGLDYVQPSADQRHLRIVLNGTEVLVLDRRTARMLAKRIDAALAHKKRPTADSSSSSISGVSA